MKPGFAFERREDEFCSRSTKPVKPPTMNRFNFFHRIHKRLKALLHETSTLLQRTDFAAGGEVKKAVRQVQFLIARFHRYQDAGEIYLLPVVMAYEPGVADALEQEHGKACRLARKLEALLANFKTASLLEAQIVLGEEIVLVFQQFNRFLNHHMVKEEQLVNRLLWRYYTDAELQKLAWKMVNSLGAVPVRPCGKVTVRSLASNEVVCWLKEGKITAPEVAFTSLLKNADGEVQGSHRNVLQGLLAAGPLLAN